MDSLAERRVQAWRNAEAGRLVVKLQRQIVYELSAIGRDSKAAEDLLSQFEAITRVFRTRAGCVQLTHSRQARISQNDQCKPKTLVTALMLAKITNKTAAPTMKYSARMLRHSSGRSSAAQCHCPVLKL